MSEHKKLGQYDIIGVGIFISFIIFLLLFWLRHCRPSLLDIDVKWICVACAPVIIALILAGVIKKFKGFGVEFETEIETFAGDTGGKIITYYDPMMAADKSGLDDLHYQGSEYRRARVLSFVAGRMHYYDSYSISEYFRRLTGIKYILIVDENQKFVGLINREVVSPSRSRIMYEQQSFGPFINALESRRLNERYGKSYITKGVRTDDTILEGVEAFKESKLEELPVVTPENRFVGILRKDGVYEVATDILVRQMKKAE